MTWRAKAIVLFCILILSSPRASKRKITQEPKVGGSPKAAAGGVSFIPGQWTKLNHSTALQGNGVDHCPPNNFGGFGYNFASQCRGVVEAWTGFGYTTASVDGACMIEAGGGHSDYAGNELYEMCPVYDNGPGQAPGIKYRLTNPSKPAESCGDIDPLSNPAAPNQGHSYQFFVVAPNVNKLYRWSIIAGDAHRNACASFKLWALDLTSVHASCAPACAASWTQLKPRGMPGSENLVETHAVFNHVDGKIWIWEPFDVRSQGCLSKFDPVANVWSSELSCFRTNAVEYMNMAIDESQNVAIITGVSGTNPSYPGFTGQIWVDLSGHGYTLHQTPVDPSCAPVAAAASPGMDYDSVRHTVVAWPGSGNALYFPVVNKATGAIKCTKVAAGSTEGVDFPKPTNADCACGGGTLGKFHYDSLNDLYVLDNNFDYPAWVWKPWPVAHSANESSAVIALAAAVAGADHPPN